MAGGGEESGGALRKALERELSMDPRDLCSHAWYHGPVPRHRAEEVLTSNGDFLVRDCVSQPGDYVLTCRALGQPLHFVINKVVTQPDTVYQRVQYQFEDEPFETVSDLITYYVGSGKPVSSASGARIRTPCNRVYPLSFYAAKYGAAHPPRLPVKKQRSLSVAPGEERACSSADGVIVRGGGGRVFSTGSLPRPGGGPRLATLPRRPITRGTSDSALSPTLERRHPNSASPPPKPSLVRSGSKGSGSFLETYIDDLPCSRGSETSHYCQRYQGSGSDSGNGSGDSAQSSAAGDEAGPVPCTILTQRAPGVVLKPALRPQSDVGYESAEEAPPHPPTPSRFNPDEFSSLLLPSVDNKPLEESVLRDIKSRLLETGPRVLANHLTRVDVGLTLDCEPPALTDDVTGLLIQSGLELLTLPVGHQLRLDLIERTESLKMLVAVTILSCGSEAERAEILNKWIQVAVETKTALGNLFGFNAIIMALCMPQISRLSNTWHVLRQKFTDSAFNFESKLRSTLKSMNEGKNPLAPNTTIPHLLPYLVLQESSCEEILEGGDKSLHCIESTAFSSWDAQPPGFGLVTMQSHLAAARDFATNVASFRRSAQIVLADSKTDELLLDVFRTEVHMKLLWGSRGAGVAAHERHTKLAQVLTVLSEKVEPPTPSQRCPPTFTQQYNRCIGTSV